MVRELQLQFSADDRKDGDSGLSDRKKSIRQWFKQGGGQSNAEAVDVLKEFLREHGDDTCTEESVRKRMQQTPFALLKHELKQKHGTLPAGW